MATMQEPAVLESTNSTAAQGARRVAEQGRRHGARQKQTLEMQRQNILSQRTSNPGRREALEAALKQIEAELAELG